MLTTSAQVFYCMNLTEIINVYLELLDHCPADVAYNLKPKIIEWNEEKNGERISRLEVVAEVDCMQLCF